MNTTNALHSIIVCVFTRKDRITMAKLFPHVMFLLFTISLFISTSSGNSWIYLLVNSFHAPSGDLILFLLHCYCYCYCFCSQSDM